MESGASVKTIAYRPQADAIVKTFEHADNPLDFIRKNLEKLASQGIDPAHAVPNQPIETSNPQPSLPLSQGQQSAEPAQPRPSSPDASQALSKVEASPGLSEPNAQPSSEEDIVGQQEGASSLTENIKNIRKSLNETKAKLHEKELELQKVVEERDKYRTGEVLPDKVKELETQVQTLSKFQALVDLETSPEYQETYVKPLNELNQKILSIAKDYEIPDEVINQALTINNQRDLNEFLLEHFDAAGVLEVKTLINQTKNIQTQAEQAKKAPKEALNKLIAEGIQVKEQTIKQQKGVIAVKAKDAWFKSLEKIRADGSIPELIITGTNTEHDEKVAKPIVQAAATEYGKIVMKLAEAGLSNLTDELSDAIANMVLLAHASAVSIEQRNEAIRRYNEVESNSRRETSYTRPPLGGSFGTGQSVQTPKITPTVEVAARNLLENVLSGYQNKGLAQPRK